MKKNNLKSLYSLDGLIIKKKNLQIIKVINILRIFSSLYFFKVDYYPFDYNKFLKFYNELVKYVMYYNFYSLYKAIISYFFKILSKNKFLKKRLGFEIEYLLK